MDTGEGTFKKFDTQADAEQEAKKHVPRKAVFVVGEEIRVRNARFIVQNVGRRVLTLRLLPPVNKEDGSEIERITRTRLMDFYQDTHVEAAVALGSVLPDVEFVDVRTTLATLAAEVDHLKKGANALVEQQS